MKSWPTAAQGSRQLTVCKSKADLFRFAPIPNRPRMYRRLVWVERDRVFPGACRPALSTGLLEPRSSKEERGFFSSATVVFVHVLLQRASQSGLDGTT